MQRKKVEKLYRYIKFDPSRLAQILIENKMYCNSPDSLNDPFDSKIQFTFQGCNDDDFRFVYRDFILHVQGEENPGKINEIVEKIIGSGAHMKTENQEKLRNHTISTFQPEINKAGIISLTEEKNDILMWTHYGDKHKGLCLEFDKQLLDKHFICRRIEYDKPFPRHIDFYKRFVKVNENADENPDQANEYTENLGQFIFCRKAKRWAYENEWRIIIPWQQIDRSNNERFVTFPDDMLTGVILGCNTGDDERLLIDKMISDRALKPKLWKSIPNQDEFKLDIVD